MTSPLVRPSIAWLIVSAGVCGLTDVSCRRAPDATAVVAPAGVSVTVAAAKLDALRDVVSVPGTVVPASTAETLVVAPGPGTITELPKKEGDAVAVGDVLARFDIQSVAQELSAREVEVTEATGRLNRAKDQVDKLTSLFDRGLTARNTLEAAKAELTSAQFALSQVNTLRDAARAHQDVAVVRARMPGVVARVFHGEGEMVSGNPNDPVLRVVDPTKVQVAVQVPMGQFGRVVPGQTVTVSLVGSLAGEPASVVFKPPVSDISAPTGEVRIGFVGPTSLTVDTAVLVEILIDERPHALVLPAAALRRDEDGSFVFVAGEDGRAHRRTVRPGLTLRDRVEIADGLTAGERVILSGFDQLSDGAAITVDR